MMYIIYIYNKKCGLPQPNTAPDFEMANVWFDPQVINPSGMPFRLGIAFGTGSIGEMIPNPSCPKLFAPHVKMSPARNKCSSRIKKECRFIISFHTTHVFNPEFVTDLQGYKKYWYSLSSHNSYINQNVISTK